MNHPQRRRDLVVEAFFHAIQRLRSTASYHEPDLILIGLIEARPQQFDVAVEISNYFLGLLEPVSDPPAVGAARFDKTRRALAKHIGKRPRGRPPKIVEPASAEGEV